MKHEGGSHDSLPAVAGRPVAAGAIRRGHALRHAAVSVCIVAGCLAGCASTPPPAGEIATARAALDSARREGAAQHAATALGDAEDRLARAERAGAARDYAIARRLAEEARITAEVAAEASRLAKVRTARDALERSGAVTPAPGATAAPVTSSTVVPVSPPPSVPSPPPVMAPGGAPSSAPVTGPAPAVVPPTR